MADKWDNTDTVQGDYNSREEALKVARDMNHELVVDLRKQKEADPSNINSTVYEVYYAYDEEGNFLGGSEELDAATKVDYSKDPMFAHLYSKQPDDGSKER